MYDYRTEQGGEVVTLRRLEDQKEITFQGDEATIILNDIDVLGVEGAAMPYFEEYKGF